MKTKTAEHDVIVATYKGDYKIEVTFDDGKCGAIRDDIGLVYDNIEKDRCVEMVFAEGKTTCYAFAFLSHHVHFLLRTGITPIAGIMRRLLTAYAVSFNKHHKRSGYLFQNRYKAILCEEEPYLLEIVRYIHLNPLRAQVVQDLDLPVLRPLRDDGAA